MKTRAIIQARMGSSRLRGKSLMPIAGTPLLKRVIQTAESLPFVDEVMVATSDLVEDDPIVAYCTFLAIKYCRGSQINVFERYLMGCADLSDEDQIVRITADNPFNRVEITSKLFDTHTKGLYDYSCISGLSHVVNEIICVKAFRRVLKERMELNKYDQEHVTAIFRKKESKFTIYECPPESVMLRPDLDKLLTVDTIDDLLRVEKIIQDLGMNECKYSPLTVYEWLENNKYRN